ncbi:MAG TPA: tRNA pseudouridine(38-40) synthase TruA [Vicinamibacterales bacterium]|jgi:tRNA pseudouridine38-40 synthase
MPRYRLTIEYAGTRYSGWQVQKNARTVQGELLRSAREAAGGAAVELQGSGRTDAGVHAIAQVAHLDVPRPVAPEQLRRQINDMLPADINVLAVAPVPHRFHARHDAVSRSYVYQIARRRTAFAKPFVWWVKEDLDVEAIRQASRLFVGMRDFQSFTDSDPDEISTLVQLEGIEVKEDGDLLLVRVTGSHFVWKMVRRIVGVLVEVGRRQLTLADIEGFFERRSPVPARVTAPASGLFLERVVYPGEPPVAPLGAITPLAPAARSATSSSPCSSSPSGSRPSPRPPRS